MVPPPLSLASHTHLCQAVAHALGQVQVTGLVDEVEASATGLAVIEQVHGGVGLRLAGDQGSTGGHKAGQHLCSSAG